MKHFLKSILTLVEESTIPKFVESLDSLRKENTELRARLDKLEKSLEVQAEAQVGLAKCTQQIALSLADVAKELGNVMLYIHEIAPDDAEILFDGTSAGPIDRKMFN
jgi:hypothetical protein